MRKVLISLVLLIAATGGLVTAERNAHTQLDSRFIELVRSTFPDTHIERTDVRGQPYLLSRFKNEVSTGYAYLEPDADGSYRVVLVQNLDLGTERARHVKTFVTSPFPDGLPEPELDTTANRSQALFGDQLITYSAELVGDTVVFSTVDDGVDERFTPAPARISTTTAGGGLPAGARISRVAPKKDGVLAEITVDDMTLTTGP